MSNKPANCTFKSNIINHLLKKWEEVITTENFEVYRQMAQDAADIAEENYTMLEEAHYFTMSEWPAKTPQWYPDYVKWLYARGIEK